MDTNKPEKTCPECKRPFAPNSKKQIFCSGRCRTSSFRTSQEETKPIKRPEQKKSKEPLPQFVLPITEILEGISLEQFKHYMETYPDRTAIRMVCQEFLRTKEDNCTNLISPDPTDGTLTTLHTPKHLPPRPIINPQADIVHRMVEAPKGTIAYFLRHGDWGKQ